jgi:hypothetical protein
MKYKAKKTRIEDVNEEELKAFAELADTTALDSIFDASIEGSNILDKCKKGDEVMGLIYGYSLIPQFGVPYTIDYVYCDKIVEFEIGECLDNLMKVFSKIKWFEGATIETEYRCTRLSTSKQLWKKGKRSDYRAGMEIYRGDILNIKTKDFEVQIGENKSSNNRIIYLDRIRAIEGGEKGKASSFMTILGRVTKGLDIVVSAEPGNIMQNTHLSFRQDLLDKSHSDKRLEDWYISKGYKVVNKNPYTMTTEHTVEEYAEKMLKEGKWVEE